MQNDVSQTKETTYQNKNDNERNEEEDEPEPKTCTADTCHSVASNTV